MARFHQVKNTFGNDFTILNGFPHAISLEEKEAFVTTEQEEIFRLKINWLEEKSKKWELERISIVLIKDTPHYLLRCEWLKNMGFHLFASKVEFTRRIDSLCSNDNQYIWNSLDTGIFSEQTFMNVWEQCKSGSDNASTTLTIEQQFHSIQTELGEGWEKSCYIVYEEMKPIAVSIPHIEPGTTEEGRLFYFGLVPEKRGKGKSERIHLESLFILKEMGVVYYIGSTHIANRRMQKVFLRNGCTLKAHIESYQKLFSYSKES
jgi:RimJ/RimL family protein N-acetyltransferase